MSATTSDRVMERKGTDFQDYPVKANTKVPAGTLVCIDSSGWAVPAADSAGYKFVGVAYAQADNIGGANGDKYVRCRRTDSWKFAYTGSLSQANVGDAVYIVDNQTVALAASTTQDIKAGIIHEYIDANFIYVDIGKAW
jgi:hypothetical protein